LLEKCIDDGKESGASIFVNIDGKDVVDLWGGHADDARTRPWTKDTIVNIWSTTKAVTSLAALVCIDRGLLDPYEKVATYWPEFATNGKQDIQVRHLLSHASGLSGWTEKVTSEDVCDLEKNTRLLEEQEPWWAPGTAIGYHALTMGPLVGGLVARVAGKSLGRFIREELAEPLGADFQLGAREEDWGRVADIIPPPAMSPSNVPEGFQDPTSVMFRTMMNPLLDATFANTKLWRGAEIGAGNGHSNACGVARMLSPISLDGTVNGVKFLSPKTVDLVFEEQHKSRDLVIGQVLRLGIGFGLPGKDTWIDWLPEGRICTWGGWGGSIVVMDLDRKMTVSYVMNKMEHSSMSDDRTKDYIQAVYKAVDAK